MEENQNPLTTPLGAPEPHKQQPDPPSAEEHRHHQTIDVLSHAQQEQPRPLQGYNSQSSSQAQQALNTQQSGAVSPQNTAHNHHQFSQHLHPSPSQQHQQLPAPHPSQPHPSQPQAHPSHSEIHQTNQHPHPQVLEHPQQPHHPNQPSSQTHHHNHHPHLQPNSQQQHHQSSPQTHHQPAPLGHQGNQNLPNTSQNQQQPVHHAHQQTQVHLSSNQPHQQASMHHPQYPQPLSAPISISVQQLAAQEALQALNSQNLAGQQQGGTHLQGLASQPIGQQAISQSSEGSQSTSLNVGVGEQVDNSEGGPPLHSIDNSGQIEPVSYLPPVMMIATLEKLKRTELQNLCKPYKIKTNQKKAALIRALVEYFESNGLPPTVPRGEHGEPLTEEAIQPHHTIGAEHTLCVTTAELAAIGGKQEASTPRPGRAWVARKTIERDGRRLSNPSNHIPVRHPEGKTTCLCIVCNHRRPVTMCSGCKVHVCIDKVGNTTSCTCRTLQDSCWWRLHNLREYLRK
mmetsp:Transcript_17440/g.24256  ORF Transcript_17440/g.24256 Transcript_17440/m.24256 type:complete len:512 (+) Transcript_17440:97-1632(+)